jgi:hypothetical protein
MIIPNDSVENWTALQERVKELFLEMGYQARSPYSIELAGRGKKEIDVLVEDPNASIVTKYVIECKWWNSSVPQDTVHAFHTVVIGCGANAGYIISKIGFQSGAREAARQTNIQLLTFEELQRAFGDEWFAHQVEIVDGLLARLDSVHHLHFDQWNHLGAFNNQIFHTEDLYLRLARMARSCIGLGMQARVHPSSYSGPEPVKMATDPQDPLSEPPAGVVWHEASTVREYFQRLQSGLRKWIAEWDQLESEAKASFAKLPEETQIEYFERGTAAMLEEMPLRILKRHLPADEYARLLKMVATRAPEEAARDTSGPSELSDKE